MCGITAAIGNDYLSDQSSRMLHQIDHRGGDDLQWATFDGAVLGFSRLAIIDAAGGAQPMSHPSKRLHLVCNGELYNHVELRSLLVDHYAFSTDSDAEVVLALYEQYGARCVHWLDGMFAFVLYDEDSGDFLAARDRFGIKPLYRLEAAGTWFFASEAKSFVGSGLPVERVELLPPGHLMTSTGTRCWYTLDDTRRINTGSPETLRALLEESVAKHLMADPDIAVGTFLSGGIDSSIITALAAKRRADIIAFTIGMEDSPDVRAARAVTSHLGIRHVVRVFDIQEARDLLEDAVYVTESYNQAVVLEGLMTILLSRLAKESGVKVVLCGEGSDEILGGYGVFRQRTPTELSALLRGTLNNIHNTECKRLDRSTMACSLEARVPFLDPAVVEYALNVPVSAIAGDDGEGMGKWLLRSACADLLPPELVWRPKLAFDDGSGILTLIRDIELGITDDALRLAQLANPESGVNSKLGLHLFRLWRKRFGALGGENAWQLFGHYPIMQPVLDARTPERGGTGEPT